MRSAWRRTQLGFLLVLCGAALPSVAQTSSSALNRDIDPALGRMVATASAIDNHAHPMLSPPDDGTDRNFDALPVDNMAPETDPLGWRPDYAALTEAWKALYNITLTAPLNEAQQKQLEGARNAIKMREGAHYSQWVLDQAHIGTQLANRVSMGNGVQRPWFLWVPYDDALLFPLDNSAMADTPDRAQFFPLEEKLLHSYVEACGQHQLPATLDAYVDKVVLPTLQRQHDGGAVAIKFEMAYLRSLEVGNPTHEQAAMGYAHMLARSVHAPHSDSDEYRALQDYLFRVIAKRAGELGLAVHLHGMAGGGRYFSISGVNPLHLESVVNDPTLKGTNFVLLHGGWPFVHEAGAMLQKPNFYLDLSQQALIIPARTLSGWLREWLELYPEKVLFGTDGYPYSNAMGWEESTWVASHNARQALGLALTGMERDGEITPQRAGELVRMVLHDNAARLYQLPLLPASR